MNIYYNPWSTCDKICVTCLDNMKQKESKFQVIVILQMSKARKCRKYLIIIITF